ncbi:MAG TPA: IclR family transcriptional regulator [Bauldia sp.]|nr:IclR family transcriptional regulator [Bauldia sp.]HVZ15290.1 IclR family transcriptional regulator [Bauldia sp.]
MAPNPYVVQPILKALRLLETIGWKVHDVKLTDIARELGLPKTTAYRYLQTLAAAGFLRHDVENDRYGIGPRVRMFAQSEKSLSRLRRVAIPEMEHLMQAFNATVNLAVSNGTDVVYVEMVRDSHAGRMRARIGDHHPIHATALGKAILAFLPPAERATILDWPLGEMTARTIRSSSALRRQLGEARENGHSIERQEAEDGFACIGVPILDGDHYPLAALSLSLPDKRLLSVRGAAAHALTVATQAISRQLSA